MIQRQRRKVHYKLFSSITGAYLRGNTNLQWVQWNSREQRFMVPVFCQQGSVSQVKVDLVDEELVVTIFRDEE